VTQPIHVTILERKNFWKVLIACFPFITISEGINDVTDMKYAAEMGSGGISFIKIVTGIQKLGWRRDTHKDIQTAK
jgi:hypothetical protein